MSETISYWKGRPLTELSNAELMQAVQLLGHQLSAERRMHDETKQAWIDVHKELARARAA